MKTIIKKIFKLKIFKYIIGWWLAALIDLWVLYLLVEAFHFHYMIWAIWAFVVSFSFGFLFQKYITFWNFEKKHISQWLLFFLFQMIWLGINLLLLFILVETFHFHYFHVAILNKFIVFIWNFVMNNTFNFK
jgi:putative flippase GtrA